VTAHRAVLTFVTNDGDEHVAAITLDLDNLAADPWHATVLNGGRRVPGWVSSEAVLTISGRSAPVQVDLTTDHKVTMLTARGPFGPRGGSSRRSGASDDH